MSAPPIANYAGNIWSNLLSFLLVPVYLHYLGVEAYGLIGGFYAVTSFIRLLDLGLSATIKREVALRKVIPEKLLTIPDLLRTTEIIYWCTGSVILLLMVLLAQPISSQWINAENIAKATVKWAVIILGLTVAIRWPVTTYRGTLIALEKQVLLNILEGTLRTFRELGAVLILVMISPTIIAFLLWQAFIAVLEVLLMMVFAWRYVPQIKNRASFKIEILQEIWRFAAGISWTTIVSIILAQIVIYQLWKQQPDVIICGGWHHFTHWLALVYAEMTKTPLLIWSESTLRDERDVSNIKHKLKSWIVNQADGYIVPGNAQKIFLTDLGAKEDRIYIAPNAVDSNFFTCETQRYRQQKTRWKEKLGIGGCVILYVGRLIDEKGIPELLEAFTKLSGNKQVTLVIVGDGSRSQYYHSYTQQHKLDNVVFTGFQPQSALPQYYGIADIFVFPTRSDTWGLVLNEAMATGLPIVCSDAAGAAPDLVVKISAPSISILAKVSWFRFSFCSRLSRVELGICNDSAVVSVVFVVINAVESDFVLLLIVTLSTESAIAIDNGFT